MENVERIRYLNSIETRQSPRKQNMFLWNQYYLENRNILVEWIGEICEGNNFNLKTFELSVAYTDIYMSQCKVPKNFLQLLGIVTILLAKKFNEVQNDTSDRDFMIGFQQIINMDKIMWMEQLVLRKLSWNLNIVVPSDYGDELTNNQQYENTIRYLILDPSFLNFSCFEIYQIAYYSCTNKLPFDVTDEIAQRVQTGVKQMARQLGLDMQVIISSQPESTLDDQESGQIQYSRESSPKSKKDQASNPPLISKKIHK